MRKRIGVGGRVGDKVWTNKYSDSVIILGCLWWSVTCKNKENRTGCFLGGGGGANGDQVKCLIFSHAGQEGGGKRPWSHLEGMQARASKGQSQWFYRFHFIVFFSPRWQPVDFPVLQAFFPSKTDRRESMRRPVTAYVTNLNVFRHSALWRGLFRGHIGHTNSKKNPISCNPWEAVSNLRAFVLEKQLVLLMLGFLWQR